MKEVSKSIRVPQPKRADRKEVGEARFLRFRRHSCVEGVPLVTEDPLASLGGASTFIVSATVRMRALLSLMARYGIDTSTVFGSPKRTATATLLSTTLIIPLKTTT